jgi:dynein heavy chain
VDDEKYDPERVAKKSLAAKSIALWGHAIYNYAMVLKIINPKRIDLAKAEAELKIVETNLKAKQAILQAVRDEIDDLQARQQASQRMAEELNQKKEQVEVQLARAEKLVTGLAAESERWKVNVKDLEVDLVNLVGNMVLAAGYISYVGPFTSKFRSELMDKWMSSCRKKGIPFNPNFSVEQILGDPIQIREWGICGLPADELSVENGIICSNAKRWPLLIDPQSQANKWLTNLEKDNGMCVTKLSNDKFLKQIEAAIRLGQPVLLENIDETLDPSLEPILSKAFTKEGGLTKIKVGDKLVDYHQDFKL